MVAPSLDVLRFKNKAFIADDITYPVQCSHYLEVSTKSHSYLRHSIVDMPSSSSLVDLDIPSPILGPFTRIVDYNDRVYTLSYNSGSYWSLLRCLLQSPAGQARVDQATRATGLLTKHGASYSEHSASGPSAAKHIAAKEETKWEDSSEVQGEEIPDSYGAGECKAKLCRETTGKSSQNQASSTSN